MESGVSYSELVAKVGGARISGFSGCCSAWGLWVGLEVLGLIQWEV